MKEPERTIDSDYNVTRVDLKFWTFFISLGELGWTLAGWTLAGWTLAGWTLAGCTD